MDFARLTKLRDRVLGIVAQNLDYFRERPKHLAWAMMNYELIHNAASEVLNGEIDNPKYPIIKAGKKLSKEDANLLYDAWYASIDFFADTNPNLALESKPDKTLDEWVELLTNKLYRYHDNYPDTFSVENHLLCRNGALMNWNSRGFITYTGPEGTDMTFFAGYTRVEHKVRKNLRQQIIQLRTNNKITENVASNIKKALERARRINAGQDPNPKWEERRRIMELTEENIRKIEKKYQLKLIQSTPSEPKLKKRGDYPLNKYSNLVRMPDNAHSSYVRAGKRIARELVRTRNESESKQYASTFLKKWE